MKTIYEQLLEEAGLTEHATMKDDLLIEIYQRCNCEELEDAEALLESSDVRALIVARTFFELPLFV